MIKRISLPTDLQVMGLPPLALLAVNQAALAMMAAAIRCEHPNLDEIYLYPQDDNGPQKSLALALNICDSAEALIKTIKKYRVAILAEINKRDSHDDFPF